MWNRPPWRPCRRSSRPLDTAAPEGSAAASSARDRGTLLIRELPLTFPYNGLNMQEVPVNTHFEFRICYELENGNTDYKVCLPMKVECSLTLTDKFSNVY